MIPVAKISDKNLKLGELVQVQGPRPARHLVRDRVYGHDRLPRSPGLSILV
jgi:hypothetical protein